MGDTTALLAECAISFGLYQLDPARLFLVMGALNGHRAGAENNVEKRHDAAILTVYVASAMRNTNRKSMQIASIVSGVYRTPIRSSPATNIQRAGERQE